MSDGTAIEWTDATWNPITGCSVVSPGCTNCYAMKLAGTRLRNHPSRAGLTQHTKCGPVWTGNVRLNEQWLDQPLRWKKSRKIFVCAHGDLFHENVPDEWIDQVFAVMALCPHHTFQVLTKRPERMQAYFTVATWLRLGNLIEKVKPDELWNGNACQAQWHIRDCRPFPNIWLGVSVEDQKRADERIPPLLETPAAIRFISAEPLLGPVDISLYLASGYLEPPHTDIINWVIVGGESGSGARPMHPAWPAVLRDQCIGAGIPFFFKQWGEWSPYTAIGCAERETAIVGEGFHAYQLIKTGKKVAGRVLDGRTWDEFPDNRAAA